VEDSDRAGRKRKIRWKRIALWSVAALVLIALVAAGSFYLWFRAQVGAANGRVGPDVIEALHETTTSSSSNGTGGSTATTIGSPSGMNIILLGSDARASTGSGGRSDTIILLHIDSSKNFLSMLSIPRDLRVPIPGHGMNKINTAYSFGGPALVIRTIESVFGIRLDHFVEVDFKAFEQITNTLGGVYVDVDRTYDDGSIQFQPGYQLLDGLNALRYVRTRHDTNYDFGRMERQQRFINAVREQAMGWNLPIKLPGLIKALFSNIDTDLSANEFLKLAYWGVKLDGTRMRQAKVGGSIQTIDSTSFVVATDAALKSAVTDFFTEPVVVQEADYAAPANAAIASADLKGVSLNVVNATGRVGQGALVAVWLMRQGATIITIKEADDPVNGNAVVTYPRGMSEEAKKVAAALGISMTKQSAKSTRVMVTLGTAYGISGSQIPMATSTTPGTILDAARWSGLAGQATFQLVAPIFLPNDCEYSFQRSYAIKNGGKDEPATRVGYQYGSRDKDMGFSATTWMDAPVASPGRRVKGPGSVIFRLVGSSTKTDHIWWVQGGVLYWVSNTLTYDLRREELLATAMSALPVTASLLPATSSTATPTTGATTTTSEATTTTASTASTTTLTTAAVGSH
jgi:LCP family protein required for cell wall assembly